MAGDFSKLLLLKLARVGLEALEGELERKYGNEDRNDMNMRTLGSVLFKAGSVALQKIEADVEDKRDLREALSARRQLKLMDAPGYSGQLDMMSLFRSCELENCPIRKSSASSETEVAQLEVANIEKNGNFVEDDVFSSTSAQLVAQEFSSAKTYEVADEFFSNACDQSNLRQFDSSFYETARESVGLRPSSSLLQQLPQLIQASVQADNELSHRQRVKSSFKSMYTLLDTLGEGSYGVVIKAEHKLDKQKYALKCIVTMDVPSHSVLNEVNAMACLHHSNIVPYHDAFTEPAKDNYDIIDRFTKRDVREYISSVWNSQSVDEPSILREPSIIIIKMQLCNESLDDWLRNNRSSRCAASMLRWIRQLSDGLDYIHKLNIVHNDFKPHNIFVDHRNCLQIGDFGLLTRLENAAAAYGKGSNMYKSPEQRKRLHNLEISFEMAQKVDMYALGLVIYEMCYDMADHEERIECFKALREHRTIKEQLEDRYMRELILDLTDVDPMKRPSAEDVIMCLDIHQNGFVPVNTYRDTFVNFVNQRYMMARKNPVIMPTDLVLTNIMRAFIGPFSEFNVRSEGDFRIPSDFRRGIHIMEDFIKNHKRLARLIVKFLKVLRGESKDETRINILSFALESMLEKRDELYPFFEQVFQSHRLRKTEQKSTGDRVVEAINHLAFLISLAHNPYVGGSAAISNGRYTSTSDISVAETSSTADME